MSFSTAAAAPSLPSWHAAIARALERGASTPASRYLQIATVRSDGRPTCRTIVFRGWFDCREFASGNSSANSSSPRLGFVTDARTAKVEHIARNPRAEACWYFAEARSQFRLSGTLAVVCAKRAEADAAAARARSLAWEKLSPNAREWHSSPAPGSKKEEEKEKGSGGALSAPAVEVTTGLSSASSSSKTTTETPTPPPHEHFCLVLLDVDSVDHVDLEKDERTLWELCAEGEGGAERWKSRVVWP